MNYISIFKMSQLVLIFVFQVCIGSGKPVSSQEGSEKIEQLIGQLKSGSYRERDEASKKLQTMGKQVVDPLFEALGSGDFETSFRALKIIKQIGLHSDLDTLETIIQRSQKLPPVLKEQFAAWSADAIDSWKESQSKIAVGKLSQQGATILEYDDFNELGFMLIEDLSTQVKEVKQLTDGADPVESVLKQIAQLKKELSGEFVEKPETVQVDADSAEDRLAQQIEIRGGRRMGLLRAGEIVVPSGNNIKLNPKKITFDKGWDGDPNDLLNLNFVVNLRQVEFVEMEINDELLAKLRLVRNLRSLQLTRCTFSFTELRKFKEYRDKSIPVQLMATGAGYLGVYGPSTGEPDNGNGSYVSLVSPDSAASAAGLERGDMIVKVDDERIRSFAELSLVISSKPVGKEITIAVKRDQKEKVLTAVLKSRAGLR